MRVAVVSDTHLPRFGRSLPKPLVDGVREARVERILHLGDWTEPVAVGLLEALGPVEGVAGNNDGEAILARFGRQKIVSIDGVRLGLTHGDLGSGRTSAERAASVFEDEADLAAILFGHSHQPLLERLRHGRLLLNPGSPTDKRREDRYSWALLEIRDRLVDAELRFFDRS